MAVPGLSLLGFLGRADALAHLKICCDLGPMSTPDRVRLWSHARRRLGAAVPSAGRPRNAAIDPQGVHVAPGSKLAMLEIAPLLATQVNVNLAHVHAQFVRLSRPPTLAELLRLCLPSASDVPTLSVSQSTGELVLRAADPNVRITRVGPVGPERSIVVELATAPPFVQVVRVGGACYLRNGYHRAIAAALAGADMIPCTIRDAGSFEALGAVGFPRRVYERAAAPTLAHFILGRALPAPMRTMSKVIRVNWSERLVPLE